MLWMVAKIIVIIIALVLTAAYLTFAERKIIAFMQQRIGPNRVGPGGWLQPIADTIKLLCKEMLVPGGANKYLFILAPILVIVPALVVWAAITFNNINLGLLFIFAVNAIGLGGIILAGWASNSKYALLGALRAAAQLISYEIPLGFALAGVALAAGSLNLQTIVLKQTGGFWHWYWLPLLPLFIVYLIAGIAETNRLPFDVAEGESELVGGFHVEYSGIMFAMFFLAEYINMLLISTLAALLFLGGWLSPIPGIPSGFIWLIIKVAVFIFIYFWLRATLPRLRYDQIMRLNWKILIPVALGWIIVAALLVQCGVLA